MKCLLLSPGQILGQQNAPKSLLITCLTQNYENCDSCFRCRRSRLQIHERASKYLINIYHLFHQSEISLDKLWHSNLPVPVHIQPIENLLGSHPGAESWEELACLLRTQLFGPWLLIDQHHLGLLLHAFDVVHGGDDVGHLCHIDTPTVVHIPHPKGVNLLEMDI